MHQRVLQVEVLLVVEDGAVGGLLAVRGRRRLLALGRDGDRGEVDLRRHGDSLEAGRVAAMDAQERRCSGIAGSSRTGSRGRKQRAQRWSGSGPFDEGDESGRKKFEGQARTEAGLD